MNDESKSPAQATDPEQWVESHGNYLFGFALARLRNTQLAEDLVQDTFLAALKGRSKFAGRSAERSWLTGILKNKIFDHFRKAGRERTFTDLDFFAGAEAEQFVTDGPFSGSWAAEHAPHEWPEPGASLDNGAFWQAFRECTAKLPRNAAVAFTLREVDEVPSPEICALLNITEGNLWVMLHRARAALRRCLEVNWATQPEDAP